MNNTLLKIISITEITGGGGGLLLLPYLLWASEHNLFSLLFFPIFLAVNLLCLISGILLWKKTSLGRTLSIITQFIHLPKIVSPVIIFLFSFGIDIYPYVQFAFGSSKLGIEIKLLTHSQLFFNMTDAPIGLGVSIVAIVFLVILFKYNPNKPLELPVEKVMPPTPNEYSDVGGDIET